MFQFVALFCYRYEYDDRDSRYRNIEYRMAADDPRFDPQVDLRTRLERLRPLIASANLINGRFGRKVSIYEIQTLIAFPSTYMTMLGDGTLNYISA